MSTAQVVPPATAGASILSTRNIAALLGLYVVYKLLQALYNVSPFHPLSGIPGPKLAAASYAPEFYHDVIRFGCYSKEIIKMHEQYGMFSQRTSTTAMKEVLITQAHSSASTPTKSTAATSPSQTKSTPSAAASATSLSTRSMGQRTPFLSSHPEEQVTDFLTGLENPASAPLTMTCIVCAASLWPKSFPAP